jgi:serine/threonine-protein kinase
MPPAPHIVGRYAMYGEIAAGGMATVHYGRLLGPVGFSRTVAVKRLHPHFAKDPEFVAMFLDEARLAARIRHPNVVQTLDVVARDGELFLVMDYVQGESLSRLVRAAREQARPIPLAIVSALLCAALHGLHAAHEATNENGEPLGIVHRDVSPQNVLVGADGVPRVLDFGVAKAAGRIHTTREGQLKGKLAYMAIEQLRAGPVDRRTDVYAAGVVLWETLTLQRLFAGDSEAIVVTSVMERVVVPPSTLRPDLPPGLDEIVLRALDRDPSKRFQSAQQMAVALESCIAPASGLRIAQWIAELAGDVLALRAKSVAKIEHDSGNAQRSPQSSNPPAASASEAPVAAPGVVPVHVPGEDVTVSQLSSVSLSTGAIEARVLPNRRRAMLLGVAGAVAAIAAIAGVVATRRAPPASASTAAPVQAPPPVHDIPPPQPEQYIAQPSPSPAAPAPAAPPLAARAGDARPAVAKQSKPASAAKPAAPAPTATAAPVCTVRAYVDDSGIKHYEKECK